MSIVAQTERLTLRKFDLQDAFDLFELNSDPEVVRYTGDAAFQTVQDAEKFLKSYSAYERTGFGRWAVIKNADSTDYFDPSDKEFMINYRVYDIEALVDQLRLNGAVIVDTIAEYPYGKSVIGLDPEGNNMELWEPVDSVLTGMGGKTTK